MKPYTFGIDIGGTYIKTGLFSSEKGLVSSRSLPTDRSCSGANILPDAARVMEEEMRGAGITPADVQGAGLGVPGPVLPGGMLQGTVNIGISGNVEEQLSSMTGMRVRAVNDADAAALGEYLHGSGRGCRNMVMVTIGTGVGAGIVINGELLAGNRGAAGEIGHIPAAEPGEGSDRCGCGKSGCLEQYASATGLVRITEKYLEYHPDEDSVLRGGGMTAKAVFEASFAGDAAAVYSTEKMYRCLGRALASVAVVTDPDMFVIGGGVSGAGEVLTEGIRRYYSEYVFPPLRDVRFVLASLGGMAGVYGAAEFVRQS